MGDGVSAGVNDRNILFPNDKLILSPAYVWAVLPHGAAIFQKQDTLKGVQRGRVLRSVAFRSSSYDEFGFL